MKNERDVDHYCFRARFRGLMGQIVPILVLLAAVSGLARAAEEKIFRTGLAAECRSFSVSPTGESLVFDTAKLVNGIRLIDLKTGAIRILPSEPGRNWAMARWASDGKHLVAISTLVRDNNYIIGNQRVILIDSHDWSHRVIASGEGVKFLPFFSADRTKVFYFRGKARASGHTIAAGFELFSINLASGQEEKLTDESFYQVSVGDVSEDGGSVHFSARGGKNFKYLWNVTGGSHSNLFSLDTRTKRLTPMTINNPDKIFELSRPQMDNVGGLYLIAGTKGDKGHFVYSLFKVNKAGEPPRRVAGIPIWADFELVRRTGDVYVPDMQQGELVFRGLASNSIHFK